MAYTPHTPKLPAEKLVAAAHETLDQTLSLPNTFHREGFDRYQGVDGDKVTVRVEGVLPYHRYAFRNDRSTSIQTDVYSERAVQVGMADHFYNATALTDEQKEWDLMQWGFLLGKQTNAISRGLHRAAQAEIEGAPYAVEIGGCETDMLASIAEARRVLNRFQVPAGARWLVVGSDFEHILQGTAEIQLAQNSGDAIASAALREAFIGRLKGFNVILDNTVDPGAGYAYVDGGFVWANAAPKVPDSIPFGATTSKDGLTMRVMRDYVADKLYDRQVVDIWSGMRVVEDVLVGWDPAGSGGLGAEKISEYEHFVRGVKLTLDGTSTYPLLTADGGDAKSNELATITKVDATEGFENGVRTDLTV